MNDRAREAGEVPVKILEVAGAGGEAEVEWYRRCSRRRRRSIGGRWKWGPRRDMGWKVVSTRRNGRDITGAPPLAGWLLKTRDEWYRWT